MPGGTGAESAQTSAAHAREARVGVADKRGVHNLEQETDAIKSANNTNAAPAYRAIRTDRYEYTIYANGQTELYDMKRDPDQLNSLARDPRYSTSESGCSISSVPSACTAAHPAGWSSARTRPRCRRAGSAEAQEEAAPRDESPAASPSGSGLAG